MGCNSFVLLIFVDLMVQLIICMPTDHSRNQDVYLEEIQLKKLIYRRTKRYVPEQYGQPEIIFPDEFESFVTTPRIPVPSEEPPCATGSTFCEKIDDYPHNLITNILQKNNVSTDGFGTDDPPGIIPLARIDRTENFLCDSMSTTIFPKIGKTWNNQWKFIINQEDQKGYVQGVRVETCIRGKEPCVLQVELRNFVTNCVQKYVTKRLLSVSRTGNIIKESFLMPSACVCSYKRHFPFKQLQTFKAIHRQNKLFPFTVDDDM